MPIRQLRTSFFRQCVYRSCAAYILYMERRAPACRTIKAFSGVGECVWLYHCCLRGEQELAVPYTGCTLLVYNDGDVLCLRLPVTGCSCLLQVYSRLSTSRRKSYPQPAITSPHLFCGLFNVLYTVFVNILYLILNVLRSYPHFYALKYMLVTQEADTTGLPVFQCPVMRLVWRVVYKPVDNPVDNP